MYLEFRIAYLEFQIRVWNSEYVFGIPNTYLEFQIRIWNSEYVFGIPNSMFHILNFEFGWQFQAFVYM